MLILIYFKKLKRVIITFIYILLLCIRFLKYFIRNQISAWTLAPKQLLLFIYTQPSLDCYEILIYNHGILINGTTTSATNNNSNSSPISTRNRASRTRRINIQYIYRIYLFCLLLYVYNIHNCDIYRHLYIVYTNYIL